MRAFFAEGVDTMHIPWAVEVLPMLLHLSVFLFFGGLVIFLFNVDHGVFSSVMWWIGLFSIVYGLITVMPIVRHSSPYYTPPSQPAWYLYAGMKFVLFKILASKFGMSGTLGSWGRFLDLRDHYHRRISGGLEKAVEKMVSERSSEMDIRIFDWTMGVLGELREDDSQEKFFEAVPGFFSSKLVKHLEGDFPEDILNRFWSSLNRFMDRTLSSDSVVDSVKTRRVNTYRDIISKIPFPLTSFERDEEHLLNEFPINFSQALRRLLDRTLSVTESVTGKSSQLVTCLDAAHAALGFDGVSHILWDILNGRWPELLQSAEIGHSLRRWSSKIDERHTPEVRRIVTQIVVGVRERDEGWISLVKAEFAVPDRDIRGYISHGDPVKDSVLLSILIHVTREALYTGSWTPFVLSSLSKFSIQDTLPELQQAFCALWNDILLEARDGGEDHVYVKLLREIRLAYIDLHRGTDAAPTFPAATYYFDPVLVQPSSYRYCAITGHQQLLSVYTPSLIVPFEASLTHLDQSPAASRPHPSPVGDHTPDGSTASQQPKEESVIVEPPSSADHTPDPSYTQAFRVTPLLPTANSVHVAHATSGPSVPGSITRDLKRLVPGEASHGPSQSAPSSAEIAATYFVRSEDPTTQMHTGESGETYQQGTVTSRDSESLSTVYPIPRSMPTVSPTIVVSEPPSSPILLPALSSGMTTSGLHLSVESAPIQPDFPHALRSPSSFLTTVTPRISQVTSSIVTPNPHDDGHDLGPPIPITLPNLGQTAVPAHDIVADTLPLEDQLPHDPDEL
jgi:hypothetical protein